MCVCGVYVFVYMGTSIYVHIMCYACIGLCVLHVFSVYIYITGVGSGGGGGGGGGARGACAPPQFFYWGGQW